VHGDGGIGLDGPETALTIPFAEPDALDANQSTVGAKDPEGVGASAAILLTVLELGEGRRLEIGGRELGEAISGWQSSNAILGRRLQGERENLEAGVIEACVPERREERRP